MDPRKLSLVILAVAFTFGAGARHPHVVLRTRTVSRLVSPCPGATPLVRAAFTIPSYRQLQRCLKSEPQKPKIGTPLLPILGIVMLSPVLRWIY